MTVEEENTFYEGGEEAGGMNMFPDFDVDGEYKADPLVPNGKYHANVRSVTANPKNYSITWEVVLDGNDGVLASDGETPVDGMLLWFRNWLPKPGDENEYSKNGKSTKRQGKINMLKKFADKMKINMGSPQLIAQGITEGEWIGKEVVVDVTISEYQGQTRNEINGMVAA